MEEAEGEEAMVQTNQVAVGAEWACRQVSLGWAEEELEDVHEVLGLLVVESVENGSWAFCDLGTVSQSDVLLILNDIYRENASVTEYSHHGGDGDFGSDFEKMTMIVCVYVGSYFCCDWSLPYFDFDCGLGTETPHSGRFDVAFYAYSRRKCETIRSMCPLQYVLPSRLIRLLGP
jgi:hypothetical protein